MFTEKNIPKLIFTVPFIGIFIATLLFTSLIIDNDYDALKKETKEIRENYILNEKQILKGKIQEVLSFIEHSSFKNDQNLLKKSTLNYIENIIAQDNGYIYILNDKSTILSHPVLKKGFNASQLKDVNGLSIADTLIKAGKENPKGSYISYFWTKPGETVQKEKTAYIYYIKEWNWIIAIGGYMDVVEQRILDKTQHKNDLLQENINYTLAVSLALTLCVFLFSFFFSRSINGIFINYKKEVEIKEEELKSLNLVLQNRADDEVLKRYKKEEELEIAYKEVITGLPNRMKLVHTLKQKNSPKLALLNIDRFTDINHCYSSEIADRLLFLMAQLLVKLFKGKKEIFIFKLPVDEFGIYTSSKEISDKVFLDLCDLAIEEIEKEPFIIEKNNIIVSITSGVSLTNDKVLINANTALKIAKNKKQRLFVYRKEDNVEVNYQNNVKWTQILKDAISNNRILVFIQPIINNNNPLDEKYECLIRLKNENGEIISPFHFLELSKKLKLYHQLTRIVIEKSFEYFKDSKAEFSINLTLDDIMNKETIAFIHKKLENRDIAKRVIFEIVESEGIDNFEEVSLFIKEMKAVGCKIAIDDFGTGYSNFEYLMKLNVDFIKIDGSFIKNIDMCEQSLLIAELIITFAKKQNIKTVAEFVHSKSVLEKVKELGITYSQGFYLGEPKSIEI
mgnify:CR=1 FL=1